MIRVIGAGLAGCEAAYQLLKRGMEVELVEMRPLTTTPAHKTDGFAELVCSNSLKSADVETSSGLLKAEALVLDSLLLHIAKETAVPSGGALAVDRALFSARVEEELKKFDKLTVTRAEVTEVSDDVPTIIATGPLTSDKLFDGLRKLTGEGLHFFDAVAPIVDGNTVDMKSAFFAGRYGKGGDDYLNCPMNKEEYLTFYRELVSAETVKLHGFEGKEVFEGCMPVEVMAKRGEDTMRFGPLKPVGLYGRNGEKYYAVVQLRKETAEGTAFNLVGFQTNLTFGEQKRVFRLIPALRDAEFLRYGVMHRNTYVNSPALLTDTFKLKNSNAIYLAGQLTGVEGYVESIVSGQLAAIHLYRQLKGLPPVPPPVTTISGALSHYIATAVGSFQPMNANFGILPEISEKDKKTRKKRYSNRAMYDIIDYNQSVLNAREEQ